MRKSEFKQLIREIEYKVDTNSDLTNSYGSFAFVDDVLDEYRSRIKEYNCEKWECFVSYQDVAGISEDGSVIRSLNISKSQNLDNQ